VLEVPSEPVVAEAVFSSEPSEPPLDDKARRLARTIASDLLLYNENAFAAYRDGPLPEALAASIREGYELFAGRCGPGRARGFAEVLVEQAGMRQLAIDASAILAALGSGVGAPQALSTAPALGGLRLVVRRGVKEGKTFVVPGTEATVGGVEDCTICLPSVMLSRRHAMLVFRQGSWWVVDLASANGTFVNERPVEASTPVHVGDRLRFGDVECEVLDTSVGEAEPERPTRKPWWKVLLGRRRRGRFG